ncbi:IS1478 transposase [Mucinivorans hirudinis]|uniref:IS1478 transposase n=1 Tax=Mucinivorans hirudinis TaxID=1433126 RepID=A0A060R686_9BACT|nr:IS1478 transposase [Mucinivorans hirudinis]CDN31182.1 IS1478 transposase [Mucinivorans hirudinis]CDN32490.1 IS1478 transposase [Mucinivorans hirudinis]
MLPRPKDTLQSSLFFDLRSTLNHRHPLFQLANKIDWAMFEREFSPLYSPDKGVEAKPIRLMVGLLILKHIRNVSDESVVEQWSENVYYQYFCGGTEFVAAQPIDASSLVHFRHRIGEAGFELILAESIRVNDDVDFDKPQVVFVDTTVQEKNITYPTDAKLHKKIVENCRGIAAKSGVTLRQSYARVVKALNRDIRFNKKQSKAARRKLKCIAGRLVRELDRELPLESLHREQIDLYKRVLSQTKDSKNKVYSLHEPSVCCISKGKEHEKWEFGNKVSVAYNEDGLIVGALSFRNEYDGHTLLPAIEQVVRLNHRPIKIVPCDRGYKGVSQVLGIPVLIPSNGKGCKSEYERKKLKKLFAQRAGIEPINGHLKSDHRMGRNFYKGIFGDNINSMLAAAAFNFKRAMNVLLDYILRWILQLFEQNISIKLQN